MFPKKSSELAIEFAQFLYGRIPETTYRWSRIHLEEGFGKSPEIHVSRGVNHPYPDAKMDLYL